MDDFEQLMELLNHMLGKKITGITIVDNNLIIKLDDFSYVNLLITHDLNMSVTKAN